ncbi:MAG: hypothetical protein JWQ66_2100 [Mucilaginibacter sp.]|nr:hypothetical protein [Mucilaginibacter sp.]
MKKYSNLNTILLIILLVFISLALIGFANKYILTVNFYERNGQPVSGIPSLESVVYQNIQHVIYLYSAIYLVVKIMTLVLIIFTGLYFFEVKVPFGDVLRIVIQAEFIFLIPAIVKIWWFYYYNDQATLEQWENFYFLSATSLTNYIKPALLYPFQTLNAFEVGYWFLLAAGIKSVTPINFDKALKIVLFSYVPSLLVWMMMVVFFTVLYFPQSY